MTTRAGFDALESDWNDLVDRAGKATHVFQSFNWNWHWANHFLSNDVLDTRAPRLAIVTGRRDGRLVMLWPTVVQRVRGVTQLFWMGEPVTQYGDVLIDHLSDAAEVVAEGWRFLAAAVKADVVRLRRVRGDANISSLLAGVGAIATDRLQAPRLDLSSATSYDEYEKRYSSHARKNRRRQRRRLEERGSIAFRRMSGGSEARALALHALALKTEWLRSKGLISHVIGDDRVAGFMGDIAEGANHPTHCGVAVLEAGGVAAAIEISFACKHRVALHVLVYNLEFEKAGAGSLLLEHSFRRAYADGVGVYDLLAPGDDYKFEWADGVDDVTDWVVPLTATGHVYARLYVGLLRPAIKRAIRDTPKPLRQFARRLSSLAMLG